MSHLFVDTLFEFGVVVDFVYRARIRLSVFGATQMAQRKWRVRRLGLGLGLGFVIALRCAICIAPNTESPRITAVLILQIYSAV